MAINRRLQDERIHQQDPRQPQLQPQQPQQQRSELVSSSKDENDADFEARYRREVEEKVRREMSEIENRIRSEMEAKFAQQLGAMQQQQQQQQRPSMDYLLPLVVESEKWISMVRMVVSR
jgi:hypothetical protein